MQAIISINMYIIEFEYALFSITYQITLNAYSVKCA